MSRSRLFAFLLPITLAFAFFAAPAAVLAVQSGVWADLSGDQEVPGPGAPDATGFAQFAIDPAAGTVCWSVFWDGIGEATAAHIHAGAAGIAGGPVVTLSPPFEEGCVDGQAEATLQAIVDAPADYYVNVHTADYPAGAIRGQLYHEPAHLYFELDGAAEVPGPGDTDGDGRGSVDVFPDVGTICYGIETQRLGVATAAHLHAGAAGVSGTAVITLDAPVEGGAGNCLEGLDPGLLAAIVGDPAGYYLNVHTDEFPDGAVRGQLSTDEAPYPTTLFAGIAGDLEVPGPGDPKIGGSVQLDLDVEDGFVCAWWNISGIDAATAAHVHAGASGAAGGVVIGLPTPFESTVGDPCTFGLDPTALQGIVDDPNSFYVNLHTEAFPDGAGRGQLGYEPPPPPPCAAPQVCDGPLAPGDYVFNGFSRQLSFTLDEEWMGTVPGDALWLEHPSGETGIYVVNFGGVVGVPPCGYNDADGILSQLIGISSGSFAEYLVTHSALDASAIVETSLGGLGALQVDIVGVVPAECLARPYLVETAGSWFRIADGEFVRVIAQDVASTIVIFVDDFDGVDVQASLDRAQPVIDSMAWGPPAAPGEGGGDDELGNAAVEPSRPTTPLLALLALAGVGGLAAIAVRRVRESMTLG